MPFLAWMSQSIDGQLLIPAPRSTNVVVAPGAEVCRDTPPALPGSLPDSTDVWRGDATGWGLSGRGGAGKMNVVSRVAADGPGQPEAEAAGTVDISTCRSFGMQGGHCNASVRDGLVVAVRSRG